MQALFIEVNSESPLLLIVAIIDFSLISSKKYPVFQSTIVSKYHHSFGAKTGFQHAIDSIATIPKSSFLLMQIVATD